MKRYKSNHGNLSALIGINGKAKRIKFVARDGVIGFFETDDVSLQKAIESDSDFGVKFFLDSPTENNITVDETTEYSSVIEVNSWQEARDILINAPYNVDASKLTSPKKLNSIAASFNLVFNKIK